jgi:hypothetical protein
MDLKHHLKLLITASLLILSIAAVRAQTATADPAPAVAAVPAIAGGYFVVYPQAPVTTIRFDGNSNDIAKVLGAPHISISLNHDGAAFNSFVRSTSSESYHDNLVDYAQRDKDVSAYKKNVKSGKWRGFTNGE